MIAIFSSILALWATSAAFTEVTPDTRAAYQIQRTANSDVIGTLEKLSAEHNARISTFSTEALGGELYLYSTSHDRPYRGILPHQNMEVKPLSELTDPRALYLLEGNSSFHHALEEELQQQGVHGEFLEVREWSYLLGDTELGKFLFLGLAAVAVMSFLAAFSHVKGIGISRLHGNGVLRICSDILGIPLLWTFIFLVTVAGMIFLYRGVDTGMQFGRYLFLAGAAFGGVAISVVAASVALLHFTHIMETISGKIKMLPVLSLTALLRVILVGVCLTWCAATVRTQEEYQAQQGEIELWKNHRTSYMVEITGARDIEERLDLQTDLAAQLRRLSVEQRLFLHNYQQPGEVPMLGEQAVMTFNRAAAKESLAPELLQKIDNSPPENVVVFGAGGQTLLPCQNAAERCTVEEPPPHQGVFTWAADEFNYKLRSQVTDPIIVVLPDDLYGIDDRNLTALLSTGRVTFSDQAAIHDIADSDARFATYFSTVSSLSQTWMKGHESLTIARTMSFVGAALAIALLLGFGLSYGILLVLGYGQRARAYRIFGLPAWSFYQKVMIWDLAVFVGGVWVLWQKTAGYRELQAGFVPEDLATALYVSPLAVALTAAAMCCATGLSVWTISRKL